jgi:ribosomal protein S5
VIEKRNREIKIGAVEALSRPAGRGLGLIAGLEGRRIGINVLRGGRVISL